MKKVLLVVLLAIAFVGCKSKSATNTKLDSKSERTIKGEFTLSSVTYPGSEYIKINSFDVADSKCFVGSQWKFVSNNNKGNFELANASCTSFTSPITWYMNKEGNFVMKILNETKAKKMVDGYILKVSNLTDASFQLVDKANVGGKMVDVVYEFKRN